MRNPALKPDQPINKPMSFTYKTDKCNAKWRVSGRRQETTRLYANFILLPVSSPVWKMFEKIPTSKCDKTWHTELKQLISYLAWLQYKKGKKII